MADVAQPKVDWLSQDLLYQVFANSVWINACSPQWASQVTMDMQSVRVPDITSNVGVDFPADADALVTAPTITLATMDSKTVSRSIIRGYAGYNKLQARQGLAGGSIQQWQNDQLAIDLGLGVDGKIREHVAGQTFDAPGGGGNDNQINLGAQGASAVYVDRNFPYNAASAKAGDIEAARELVWEGLRQSKLLLATKKIAVPQARSLGVNAPSMVAAIMPVGLATNVISYLAATGQLQQPSDIAAQAAREVQGMASSVQYQGRAWGIDIWVDLSMDAPAANAKWDAYVVPINGPVVADFQLIDRSERDFSDGTTGHSFIHDVTQIGLFGVQCLRPEHVVNVQIESEAS